MKKYKGIRTKDGCKVTVDEKRLPKRLDLWNHSPTGFEWGYGGSGPAQLALAILADHLGDDEQASLLCHRFKRKIIAHLPKSGWILTGNDIEKVIHEIVGST